MGLDALLTRMECRTVTSVTADVTRDVTLKPRPVLGCTPVTSVTPEKEDVEDTTAAYAWLVRLNTGDSLEVFSSMMTRHEVLAEYPTAISAEPIPEKPKRLSTETERAELSQLVTAIYVNDTEVDRAEALAMALADPEGALVCYRAIANERGQCVSEKEKN